MKYLLIVFVIFSQVILSQQDSIKTYELNEITIKSEKYNSLIKYLNPSLQTVNIKEVNLTINKNIIANLKNNSAGIFVTEYGNNGFGIGQLSAGKLSVRGFNGIQQFTVFIDGHPEYAGIFGHPVSDVYNTDAASELMIIKGPASLIYGSGAMAGAIDIRTSNQAPKGFSIGSDISYGSFNTFNISLKSGYSSKSFASSVNLYNYHSDNHRPSSNYDSRGISLTIGYKMSKAWSANIKSNIRYAKIFNPGTTTDPYLNDSVWTEFTRSNISLSLANGYKSTEGTYTFYINTGVHDFFDGFHSTDYVAGLNGRQTFELSDYLLITAGNDTRFYGGKASNNRQLIDTTLYETGFYLVTETDINQRLKLTAGARLNYHEIYGTEFVPQASLNYAPADYTDFYFSVAKGFRNPTLAEFFIFGANIDLLPEKLWNYEAGFNLNFLDKTANLSGAFYFSEGKDFIAVTGQFPNIKNRNVANVQNKGFEINLKIAPLTYLRLSAGFNYTDMKTKIPGAPGIHALFNASYSVNKIEFGLNLVSAAKLYLLDHNNQLTEEKFLLLNVSAGYDIARNAKLYIKVNNLLDTDYQTVYGYPMPGINFLAGIKTEF
ncbi:TonB-dependent receptor [Melioribacter sp. Ez-97]|uniref:TonB-dependent receptor n=1 Tax=Melioribacter sp. Ez-97 TaxID=3423434 RepID=UPI003ED84657